MLDVLLMPATDDFKFDPQAKPDSPTSYRSKFSHADEEAVPGYYRVYLQDSCVKAELTATERVGDPSDIPFRNQKMRAFLLTSRMPRCRTDAANPDAPPTPSVRWASLRSWATDTIVGGRCTDIWAKGRQDLFLHEVFKALRERGYLLRRKLIDGATRGTEGTSLRCVLKFRQARTKWST